MSKGVRRLLFWLGCLFLLGVVVALILPAVHSTHTPAWRISCANNLKQIGLGMKMYATDHEESFPSKLVDIRNYMADQASLFVCPASGNKFDPIDTVDEWTDYVYVSGLSETSSPEKVLAYCPAKNHQGEGGNVLFNDGHVEWFNSEGRTSGEPSFEDMMKKVREQQTP